MNFKNNVGLKLYNEFIRSRCEAEDCRVIVKHDQLIFPKDCTPDCGCRKRILKLATKRTGHE